MAIFSVLTPSIRRINWRARPLRSIRICRWPMPCSDTFWRSSGSTRPPLQRLKGRWQLNPNYVDWRFGAALVLAGQSRQAVDLLEACMRLDPFYSPVASATLGLAHYMLEKYEQALPALRDCVSRSPNFRAGHSWL